MTARNSRLLRWPRPIRVADSCLNCEVNDDALSSLRSPACDDAPSRWPRKTLKHVFSHPLLPTAYTQLGRTIAAGSEIFERATRRYGKPTFGYGTVTLPTASRSRCTRTWRATPVLRAAALPPRHHCAAIPKVLLVAPLSGHYATLLRGTVAALLPDHDVHITDWVNAAQVPIARGALRPRRLRRLRHRVPHQLGPNTHVIAVCQPSVPVLAAVVADGGRRRPAPRRAR